MKRMLCLFLIATSAYAGSIDELEKVISKSDLPAVEKLLAEKISISHDEKVALINLATEIIRKRENKVVINRLNPNNGFQSYDRKYLEKNYELKRYKFGALAFLLTTALSPMISLVGIAACDEYLKSMCHLTNSEVGAIALTSAAVIFIVSLGAAAYNLVKYNSLTEKLIEEHDAHSKNRYNQAIQIRQLLYKIKPA